MPQPTCQAMLSDGSICGREAAVVVRATHTWVVDPWGDREGKTGHLSMHYCMACAKDMGLEERLAEVREGCAIPRAWVDVLKGEA